jgi:hypothetical protein
MIAAEKWFGSWGNFPKDRKRNCTLGGQDDEICPIDAIAYPDAALMP